MAKRLSPQTQVIYERGDVFNRYTGEDLDQTGPSTSVQDFMRDMGEYFDRLNVSKDVRETTTAFVLGLQGMERNLFEVSLRQVLDQLDTGAENISNPLNEGFIGGLEYLEYFAPSLHDFFNDMFGDKDTLPASDVATSFGLTEDQFNSIPAQAERIGAEEETTVEPVEEEEEVSLEADSDLMGTSTVEETIGDEDFTTAPLPTPDTTIDDEVVVDDVGGTETTDPDTSEETAIVPYELPEGEAVDVGDLNPEEQTAIWPKIKEALGGVSENVGKIIFGPSGMPTSINEWLEWVDRTLQSQMGPPTLPFPIVITTAPGKGTWLDLKIPVNINVNGNPLRIPLFDADGNFVGGEVMKDAVVNAAGEILGPLGRIGDILTDGEGDIIADIKGIGEVLLDDLSINPEDGTLTGSSTAAVALGRLFLNPDTGEWEEKKDEVAPTPVAPVQTEETDIIEETTSDVQEQPVTLPVTPTE